jgi:transposase
LPVTIVLTGGQAADVNQAETLLDGVPFEVVIGDKGYDSQPLVDRIEAKGGEAVIPSRKTNSHQRDYDRERYKDRNLAERFWNKIADEAEDESEATEETDAQTDEAPVQEDDGEGPVCFRTLDLALAAGYVLRTKANGWKLFCERLNVPPFLVWEMHPGFDRLQLVLALADKAAFVSEGFLRWLNRVRPKREPEMTAVPLSVKGIADETKKAFRWRVQWWGAEKTGRSNVTIRSRLKKLELASASGGVLTKPPRGIDCQGMSLDEIYTRIEGAYPEGWEEYIGKIAEEIDGLSKRMGKTVIIRVS